MVLEDTEDSDNDEDTEEKISNEQGEICSKHIIHEVEWIDKPVTTMNGRLYYDQAKVGNNCLSS